MRINVPNISPAVATHEGAPAKRIDAFAQLRRISLASMLWEDQFYVDGQSHAQLIAETLPLVAAEDVAALAIEAREKQKLRHLPLLLVRELARRKDAPSGIVSRTLARIIQRADELTEFLAIYWKDGRQPLSNQVKKGLAKAFRKFNAYQLAKYDRANAVRLRDVLFLTHPKPTDEAQQEIWNKLVANTLESPDTWEVALSAGLDKKETWLRLLAEKKLGALALLRNLRNMREVGVGDDAIRAALIAMKIERVLPYRFIAAARYTPALEDTLEQAMFTCVADAPKLSGKTILLVDVSGSMDSPISAKSDLRRIDAACGLAMLARELCAQVAIVTFSDRAVEVAPRRGFALRDAIVQSQPHSSTYLGAAVSAVIQNPHDRLIVITDEQSHDPVPNPLAKGYVINVAAYKNGVGYGAWTHIDGWSEAVFDFIREAENEPSA